ncbi:mCG1034005, partial [Mus musculus]
FHWISKEIITQSSKEKVDLFIVGHYKERKRGREREGRERVPLLSTVTAAILQLIGNVAQ